MRCWFSFLFFVTDIADLLSIVNVDTATEERIGFGEWYVDTNKNPVKCIKKEIRNEK